MIPVSREVSFKEVAEQNLVFRMSEGKKAEFITSLERLKEVNSVVYSRVKEALKTIALLYPLGATGGIMSDPLEDYLAKATEADISEGINNLRRTVCVSEQNLFMVLTKYMTHQSSKFGSFYREERDRRGTGSHPVQEIFELADRAKAEAPKKLEQAVSSYRSQQYRKDTKVI